MQRSFQRSIDSLDGIFRFVEEFFSSESIEAEHLYAVNFAIEEVFTNMVKYGVGGQPEILLDLNRTNRKITLRLTDFDVEPYDVTAAPETQTDLPLEQRTPGGLGLQLTKRMMDGIEYDHTDGHSRVTVYKKIG